MDSISDVRCSFHDIILFIPVLAKISCVCLFEPWKTFKAGPTEEQIEIAKYEGFHKMVLLTRTDVRSTAESVADILATPGWPDPTNKGLGLGE